MTSASGTGSCSMLLRDVSRRLTHEINNAANGVAVNLEVVRSRSAGDGAVHPFAEKAAQQLEAVTALQEILRSLLQLTMDTLDEEKVSCGLSPSGDAFEIIFPGAALPQGLRAPSSGVTPVSLRNTPSGVILTVPRTPPSSE